MNMIQLKTRATKMVRCEADLDEEAEETVLRVPSVVFKKAVGLAEVANPKFRAPPQHFMAAHCAEFVTGITLATQQEVPPPTRMSRMTALHQLTEFFRVPDNKKWLERLTAFAAVSKGFTIED